MELTELQKATFRLSSIEIAIKYGTKADIERDACYKAAQRIYEFAIGKTNEAQAPGADKK